MNILMVRDDVSIEEVFDECDACTGTVTGMYTVVLNFRNAGEEHRLGRYCRPCAETLASRIRGGLPERSEATR